MIEKGNSIKWATIVECDRYFTRYKAVKPKPGKGYPLFSLIFHISEKEPYR